MVGGDYQWRIISGPPSFGKSKLGEKLAESDTSYIHFDTDFLLLEQHLEIKDIGKFISSYENPIEGWTDFRRCENNLVKDLVQEYKGERIILTVGGGLLAPQSPIITDTNKISYVEELARENYGALSEVGNVLFIAPHGDVRQTAEFIARHDKNNDPNRPSQGEDWYQRLEPRWKMYLEHSNLWFFGDGNYVAKERFKEVELLFKKHEENSNLT